MNIWYIAQLNVNWHLLSFIILLISVIYSGTEWTHKLVLELETHRDDDDQQRQEDKYVDCPDPWDHQAANRWSNWDLSLMTPPPPPSLPPNPPLQTDTHGHDSMPMCVCVCWIQVIQYMEGEKYVGQNDLSMCQQQWYNAAVCWTNGCHLIPASLSYQHPLLPLRILITDHFKGGCAVAQGVEGALGKTT